MKEISFSIPVIRKIEEFPDISEDKSVVEIKEKIITHEIIDRTKNEIISATKVSVFKQCPLKYQLTYEYGFSPLFNQYKSWYRLNPEKTHFEFSDKEEYNLSDQAASGYEGTSKEFLHGSSADMKGRIIHSILQNELSLDEIEDFTAKKLKDEIELLQRQDEFLLRLKNEIVDDLKKFYVSSSYLELKKKHNYKNEFEIYINENNYFLYGIIDKIIFDNNKIIIVDYKTDNIEKNEIPSRVRTYINQLKFYSYIAINLFPDFDIIELRLLFVKHPEEFISEVLNKQDIMNFESTIKTLVNEIRNKNFSKNLEHCKECYFAIEEKCVKN
ncbi:MAG: PD-(D/E)XK nuclease family protein [Ignavibacteriaceae bacterium]